MVKAQDLLVPERLDIAFRFPLIRSIVNDTNPSWGIDFYFQYLDKCRNFGPYSEGHKSSFLDYLNDFLDLIQSMNSFGYIEDSPAIKTNRNIPIEGAHRIAVARFLNLDLPIEQYSHSNEIQNIDFLIRQGLSQSSIDFSIQEFIRYQASSRILILCCDDKDVVSNVSKYLRNNSNFLVEKRVHLSQIGKRRLID